MFAAIRPHSIDLALVVHVAGAMVLVGGLVTASAAAIVGWRDETGVFQRFSYKVLLAVAFPGYIVMRLGAQWVFSKEFPDSYDPTWLGIGFITADLGGVLLLLALLLGGAGMYRSRGGGGSALLRASAVISTLLVAAYVVAVWAMGAKPT